MSDVSLAQMSAVTNHRFYQSKEPRTSAQNVDQEITYITNLLAMDSTSLSIS